MRFLPFLLASTAACTAGLAQAQSVGDGTALTIPYSVTTTPAVGTGVEISAPTAPMGECVTYQSLTSDTAGAYKTEGELTILSSYEQQKRDIQLDLGYTTSAKVKAAVFDANVETKITGKFGDLTERESRSLVLMFSARSEHGRDVAINYSLKPEFSALLTADPTEFRKRCGTHFIRAVRKVSDATIFVKISGLSESGKDSLQTTLQHTVGGGVKLAKIGGEASSTLTADYRKVIEFAKKSGRVEAKAFAMGGPGPGSVASALESVTADPGDLGKIALAITNASSQFTAANAAPWEYLLVPYTVFGAPPVQFDQSLMIKVGKLTEQLSRVNGAIRQVDGYRTAIPDRFETYFGPMRAKLQTLQAALASRITTCVNGGSCEGSESDQLADFVFLGDVFSKSSTVGACSFQKASALLHRGGASTNPRILDSISVNLTATAPYYDLLDFSSAKLLRLKPDFTTEDVTSAFSGFAVSRPTGSRHKRLFGTVYYKNLRAAELLSVDPQTKAIVVDLPALSDRREEILRSMYIVEVSGPGGARYSFNLGFPDRQQCNALISD